MLFPGRFAFERNRPPGADEQPEQEKCFSLPIHIPAGTPVPPALARWRAPQPSATRQWVTREAACKLARISMDRLRIEISRGNVRTSVNGGREIRIADLARVIPGFRIGK